MTAYEIIMNSPLNPTVFGTVKRIRDGKVFGFAQNVSERSIGGAVLSELKPVHHKISDVDCVIGGLPFDSAFVKVEDGLSHIADERYFEILTAYTFIEEESVPLHGYNGRNFI